MIRRTLGKDAKCRKRDRAIGRDKLKRLGLGHVACEHFLERRETIGVGVDLVAKFAVVPPIDGHGDDRVLALRDRCRRNDGHLRLGRAGLEAVDRTIASLRGEHQQIAGFVDRQIDRVERGVADDLQSPLLGPAPDALKLPIDEVQPALFIHCAAADRMKVIGQFFDRRAKAGRLGSSRIIRHVEHGKFAFAHVDAVGHVLNRVGIGKFGDAQECRAAIFVAGAKAALAIHMNIAKTNVAHIIQGNGRRRGLARAGDAIAVKIGNQDIVGVTNFQRSGVTAFAPLSFGLRGQQFPVGHPVQRNLAADMMFDRRLNDPSGRFRVGNQDAGMREGAGAPYIGEGAAAALRHPQAGILPVPAPRRIGVARRVVVIGIDARAIEQVGAMPALEFDIIDHRLLAGLPQQGGRPLVGAVAVDADALDDRIAALCAFDDGLGRADALKPWRPVRQNDLRQAGVQAYQHRVWAQAQSVTDAIEAGRQVDDAMGVDRPLQRVGVIRPVISLRAQRTHADPVADRGQRADRGVARSWQGIERCRLHGGFIGAHAPRAGQGQPIGEAVDLIGDARSLLGAATVPEMREHRHVGNHHILEANLRIDILFIGDDDAGLGDIFKAHVLAPQPVAIALVDFDADRRVADRHIDHGQPSLMLPNGGVALPFECGVDKGKGPGRGGFLGQYAIASAIKVQILGFIGDMIEPGQAGPDVEVRVGHETMLCGMKSDRRRGRIAIQYAKIDIGERGVEGAGVRVGNILDERNAARWRKRRGRRALVGLALAASEHQHMGDAPLKSGRVRAKEDDGSLRAYAEKPHAGIEEQCPADAIGAGGQENDTAPGSRGLVDRLLDRGAVIGAAVAYALHRHGTRLVRGRHIDGWRRQHRLRACQAQQHRCAGSAQSVFHAMLSTGKNMSRPCRAGTGGWGQGISDQKLKRTPAR